MVDFSASVKAMRSSAIRELLNTAVRPDIISFAGGMPIPRSFRSTRLTRFIDP